MSPADSLYRQVLGADFDSLDRELQIFHNMAGNVSLPGRCEVKSPQTVIGRLMGRVFSLPKATAETDFLFELDADSRQETWRRHYPGRTMISRMQVKSGTLVERLGPVDLHFKLKTDNGRLTMLLQRITVCGIPCPRFLVPSVLAEETASPGKLHFNVAAYLPLVGVLAEYRGYLKIEQEEIAI
ncbi:MAG: hypothetical protein JWQ61_1563 [Collimonas fungivorans]|uniref:DUF4166 domain-containing protein n=1 Tax=Collimonas fungivorans TaxID=158899 RepID=UPI0026F02B63|nr:DUF4166 domain-containing protein [Collimonas fungivorans]MDB5766749.1 hypothetical protein [Collimonas fungivorans]